MNYNSLKQSVHSLIQQENFTESDNLVVNKIILGVLVFKTAQILMQNDKSLLGNITSTAKQYISTYTPIVESLENKYITYKEMKKFIERKNISLFINIKQSELEYIYYLYEHKQTRDIFSTTNFSSAMYNITSISIEQANILKQVHFKVMVPIVQYYEKFYKLQMGDVSVNDNSTNFPGKKISLSLSGISANQIYNDLLRDKMNIGKYLYDYSIGLNNIIELIIK